MRWFWGDFENFQGAFGLSFGGSEFLGNLGCSGVILADLK